MVGRRQKGWLGETKAITFGYVQRGDVHKATLRRDMPFRRGRSKEPLGQSKVLMQFDEFDPGLLRRASRHFCDTAEK